MKDRKPTLPTPPCVFTSSISQQLLGTVLSRSPGYFQIEKCRLRELSGRTRTRPFKSAPCYLAAKAFAAA